MTADFDAGSIAAHATLDQKPFLEGLKKARQDARDFAREKIEPKVTLDSTEFNTRKAQISADLDLLDARNVSVGVDLDITGALAKIAVLKAAMAGVGHVGGGSVLSDGGRITNGVEKDISKDLGNLENGGGIFGRLRGLTQNGTLGFGQIGGALTGKNTVGRILDAGGLGGGIARIAGGAARPLAIGSLGGGLATGVLSIIPGLMGGLSQATAGLVAFASAAAVGGVVLEGAFKGYSALVKGDLAALKANPNAFGVAGRNFTAEQKDLANTTKSVQRQTAPGVFGVLSGGLDIANSVLPKFIPIINTISGGLMGIEKIVGSIVNSKGFSQFLATVQGFLAGFLKGAGPLIGTVLNTFFTAFEKLQPILKDIGIILTDVVNGIAKFVNNISSKQIEGWANSVMKLLPEVFKFLKSAFDTLMNVLKELQPVVRPFLTFIETLGHTLAKIDLKPIAVAFGDMFKAITPLLPVLGALINTLLPPLQQIFSALFNQGIAPLATALLTQLMPAFKAIGDALAQVAPYFGQFLTSIANLVNPTGVGLLVILIKEAAKIFAALAPPVLKVLTALESVVDNVITALMPAFKALVKVLDVLLPPIAWLAGLAAKFLAWGPVTKIITGLAVAWAAVNVAAGIFAGIMVVIESPILLVIAAVAALAFGIYELIKHWKDVTHALDVGWRWIKALFMDGVHAVGGAFTWLYNSQIKPVVDGIASAWNWLWNNAIKPVASFIASAFNITIMKPLQAMNDLFGAVTGGIASAVQWVWNIIKPILDAIGSALDKVGGAISKTIGAAKGALGAIGKGASFLTGGLLATGGQVQAAGFYDVGEYGRETVFLPEGSTVLRSDQSDKIAAQMGGGSSDVATLLKALLAKTPTTDDMVDALAEAYSKAQVDATKKIITATRGK